MGVEQAIGYLSSKYEANGANPGTVSQCSSDAGGWSYGMYQLASNPGSVQTFVEWLQNREAPYDEYGNQLALAGDPRCDQGFVDKWVEIANADPIGFMNLQDEYAKEQYMDYAANNLLDWYGFDIYAHSNALQQVLMSNSIQHGPRWGAKAFGLAADRAEVDLNSMSDSDIITNLYSLKIEDESWSDASPDLKEALKNRWADEMQVSLGLLNNQGGLC